MNAKRGNLGLNEVAIGGGRSKVLTPVDVKCETEPKIDPAGMRDNDLKTLKVLKNCGVKTYAGRGPTTTSIYE